jgi:hypothetical protein
MRYWRAYGFVFDHPKWAMNLLCGAVCMLIPVAGHMVFMGWMFEVIESFHRRGTEKYPPFEFGRFTHYLMRGLWPFVVVLILGLATIPLVILLMAVIVIVMVSSQGKPDWLTLTLVIVGSIVAGLFLNVLMMLVKTPMVLRAGFTQELKGAFAWSTTIDFLKKMWLELLLAGFFLVFTSIPIILLGELCCLIGVYPASALVLMAEHHLLFQLYELYLKRGGMAIPLKPAAPVAPPTVTDAEEAEPV